MTNDEVVLELANKVEELEHLVKDVLIGGLKTANDEYIDDENYGIFVDKYGESIEPLVAPYKILNGEDYDIKRDMYDSLKGVEGYGTEDFDEDAIISAKIAELQKRIEDLENLRANKEDVEEKEVTKVTKEDDGKKETVIDEEKKEDEFPSDDELIKILESVE